MDTVAPEMGTGQAEPEAHTDTGLSLVPLSTRGGRVLLAELKFDGRTLAVVRMGGSIRVGSRPCVVVSPEVPPPPYIVGGDAALCLEVPNG